MALIGLRDLFEDADARYAAAKRERHALVFYKGEPIGAIRKFSDTLLMFLLKAHNPKKYRENMRVERSGKMDTGPRKVEFIFREPPVRPADPEPDTEEEPNG